MKESYSKEAIRQMTKKMMDDKKSIQEYIKKNGSINGFNNDSIVFAKPL